jgi:hypothetical protein
MPQPVAHCIGRSLGRRSRGAAKPRASRLSRNLDIDWPGCYHDWGFFGEIMRRRLEAFIPIVLLAILVQLLAPISAFRFVAYVASDPLHLASICSGTGSSGEDPSAPGAPQRDHDCCAFCAAGLGGAIAINTPPLIFVSLQRLYQRVAWLEAADSIAPVRVGSNTQARAPPQLT